MKIGYRPKKDFLSSYYDRIIQKRVEDLLVRVTTTDSHEQHQVLVPSNAVGAALEYLHDQ